MSLLYVGADAEAHADGDTVTDDAALVDPSVNAEQTRTGRAYLTLYTSTDAAVRDRFVELARAAPGEGSVWAADRSGGFRLTTQSFDAWPADQSADDDPVERGGERTTLPALVTQDGDGVSLGASPLELVFVEP